MARENTSETQVACEAFTTKQLQSLAKNPHMVLELFEKLKGEGSGGVDGGFWMQFQKKIGSSLCVKEEIWIHFGDEKMLLLMRDYLNPLFLAHDYKNKPDNIHTSGFSAVQNAVMISAKLGFEKCFEFFMQNVNIQDFDIDAVCLHSALDRNHSNILVRILMNTSNEDYNQIDTYGFNGSLRHMIQPRIKEAYSKTNIPDSVYNALWVLKILR